MLCAIQIKGHVCLCMKCVKTTLKQGRCPVDRCEVTGLYRLQGDQIRIHESMRAGTEVLPVSEEIASC